MTELTLPNGWKLVLLGNEVEYKKGKKPSKLSEKPEIDEVPYVDIKAFEKGIIEKYAKINTGIASLIDDTLMVWDGARSGLVGTGIIGIIGSTLMRVRPISSYKKYFHYFLQSLYLFINSNTKGTGIPHVDPDILWSIRYPLPPLNEQQRIANKLDKLLAQVDSIKSRIDNIPKILKRFRQSVLNAAVTGKLTEKWRGDKDFINETIIGKISSQIRYGTSKKCSYNLGDTPVIRIPNIKNSEIDLTDCKFANFSIQELEKLGLKEGDILFVRSNGSIDLVGRCALVTKKYTNYVYAGYLICIRFNNLKEVLPKYILYSFQSSKCRKKIEMTARSTNGINNINSKELANLKLLLPPIEEQTEIVKRVESLLAFADQVEQRVKDAQTRINNLTQSILAKAFRGELVPQDPNDEPASELLKRIQQERQQAAALAKVTKKAITKTKTRKTKKTTVTA